MITVIFFYFFLLVFWLENVLGVHISTIKGISLLNIALYLMLIAWAINIVRKKKIFNPNKLNKYLIILFCVVAASIPVKYLLNEVPHESLFQELIYLKGWLNPVLLFFILYNTLDNERHCRLALGGLLVFFTITVLSTIGESTGILHIGKLKIVQESRSAGFAEPNQYAAYLVLFLPLLFSGALFSTGIRKLLSIMLIFLAIISLIITGSRGGIISLVFACVVYCYVFASKKLIKLRTILIVILIGLPLLGGTGFLLSPQNVREKFLERFNPTHTSNADELTSGRITLWTNSLKLFFKSPVFGHGQNTIHALMKKYFSTAGNSHNDYLLYMVHFGIVGLIIFLLILWTLFRQTWLFSEHSVDNYFVILSLSYFSGLAGFSLAMFGVNIIQPLYFLWAYSAIILRSGNINVTG